MLRQYKPDKKFYYQNNCFLNYRTIGSGKTKIILLHGFGASNRTWDDVVPLLSLKDSQLILIDLIGFGFSFKPQNGDYSFFANACSIADFIQEQKINDFILVGHSFGGAVALIASIELKKNNINPKGLILIDAAAYKTKLPFFISALRIPILSSLILPLLSATFLTRFSLKKIYFNKNKVTQDKINRYLFFMLLDGHNHAMFQTANQLIPDNLIKFQEYIKQYDDLKNPVLIIWGQNDSIILVNNGIKLSKQLPNVSLSIIKNCGHIPQEEEPEKTAQIINNFVNSL